MLLHLEGEFHRALKSAVLAPGSPIPNLLGLVLEVDNLSFKTQSKRKKGTKYTRAMFYLSFTENNLNYHQRP